MAKKVLTPEQAQIKAMKKAKKSENWTKFWAILLAAVLTFGIVALGKSAGEDAAAAAGTTVSGENTDASGSTDEGSDDVDFGGSTGSTDSGSTGSTGNAGSTGNSGSTGNAGSSAGAADTSTADAVALLNKVTAAAANGSYNWKRVSDYTEDGAIDVGSATDTLDGIIKGVDENASLDSVVGGFLGIGTKEAAVVNGKLPESGMSEQHLLVATRLTDADIQKFAKQGDVYMFQIKACSNPKKDGSNPLSRATNDFFTHEEVVKGISDAVGSALTVDSSDVKYSAIVLKATIVGEKLTNFELSYTFSATLNLKAVVVPITGKGKATNNAVYSNIAY